MSLLPKYTQDSSDIYNEFTDGLGLGFGTIKDSVHFVNDGIDSARHWAAHASHIPLVDDFLGLALENPAVNELVGTLDMAEKGLDIVEHTWDLADGFIRNTFNIRDAIDINAIREQHKSYIGRIPTLLDKEGKIIRPKEGSQDRMTLDRVGGRLVGRASSFLPAPNQSNPNVPSAEQLAANMNHNSNNIDFNVPNFEVGIPRAAIM